MKTLNLIVADFYHAFYRKKWIGDKSAIENLSNEVAYKVQDLIVEKRIRCGESIAAYKVGCTSRTIREQFGLTEPIT